MGQQLLPSDEDTTSTTTLSHLAGNNLEARKKPNPVTSPTPHFKPNENSRCRKHSSEGVRARPRPSGRSVSPATLSLRRSGFVVPTNSRSPSPWDTSVPGFDDVDVQATHAASSAKRDHLTLWENLDATSKTAAENVFYSPFDPFDSPSVLTADPFLIPTGTSTTTSSNVPGLQVSAETPAIPPSAETTTSQPPAVMPYSPEAVFLEVGILDMYYMVSTN